MGLDIRIPIGSMFAVLGALLAGYGLLGDKSIYSRSLGINLNLDWGIVLLVFGVVLLFMSTRKRARARPAR
jgi:hypothetical protein